MTIHHTSKDPSTADANDAVPSLAPQVRGSAEPLLWDIFCQVIDNYGDVGVCWRLAADLAARGDTGRRILPFERKLGSMKRELDERKRNLETPIEDRGEYNAKHPFGTPRKVEQFRRPELAG